MKIISHRGNLVSQKKLNRQVGFFYNEDIGDTNYKIRKREPNTKSAIEQALEYCDMVEVDVWLIGNNWYLGHDLPTEQISWDYIVDHMDKLLLHCKNVEALGKLVHVQREFLLSNLHFFWHDKDKYTLTSQNVLVAYPGSVVVVNCINMMPENAGYRVPSNGCWGVCTDSPLLYLEKKHEQS